MNARYVLFLDGGATTGWALYDRDEDRIFIEQLDTYEQLGKKLEAWMGSSGGPKTALGAERYVITPMSARKDPNGLAIQVYGLARWLAHRCGAVTFVGNQNSSSALHFVSDDLLKRVGWYRPGMPHGNDAARHVIKFLEAQRALPDHIRGKIVPE